MRAMMDFNRITGFFYQVYGLELGMYDPSFLVQTFEKRLQETGCDSLEDYYASLEQNHGEWENLFNSLHIHYSEFFRDPLVFTLLERFIIPELIQKKKINNQKEIRIWSVGCAAGQESYSLAILLEEALLNTDQSLNYRIFATDLDETLLSDARLGRYPIDVLTNLSLKRIQRWFTRQGEDYVVQSAVQQHIDFSRFDLLEREKGCPPVSIFGDFDLVCCCNLLLYYQPKYQKMILNNFTNCIAPGGYLVTGETERAVALAHRFSEIYPQAAIFRVNRATEIPPSLEGKSI
jgi:chemotaxis protein methyltransferase CheR